MSAYQRAGTDVLDSRGVRIACCTDETNAMLVLNALLAMEERSTAARCEVQDALISTMGRALPAPTYRVEGLRIDSHTHQRQADEYACSCGLRWGVDEDDPHGA